MYAHDLVPDWRTQSGLQIGIDHAKPGIAREGGLPLRKLEQFLEDLRHEKPWRLHADRCADYYDGNQLDHETLKALADRGLGPLMRNLIAPTIDAVLGLEERTRTDYKVNAASDRDLEVAEALNEKLNEAEKKSGCDKTISDTYAGQIKAGFQAVEVSRASNPFHYRYRVESIHRRELFWDPRSRKPDWSDARFVLRSRWFDLDVVAAYFPRHIGILKYATGGVNETWEQLAGLNDTVTATMLERSLEIERQSTIEDMEWKDVIRDRVRISEVWYRVYVRGYVMELPDGRVLEFDKNNPRHSALYAAGVVKPREAVYDKLRCAFFCGPHRLEDFPSNRRTFPYIPFWGKREDLTGAPYGLVSSMLSVQDEVNARLAKMMWLLTGRRTMIDADAVSGEASKHNTLDDVSQEVARADGFIVLNQNRRRDKAIVIDENLELADSQQRAMQSAVEAMPMVSGVYAALLGQDTSTTAASALRQLIDQGTITLAEINGNYLYGKHLVGEALLELVKEDNLQPQQLMVDTGMTKKSVYINRPAVDPVTGESTVENSVQAAQVKVGTEEVPSTPSYRAQQFTQLSEVTKSLPPQVQAFVTPFLIEATDLPQRKQLAKLLREKLGIQPDDGSPEAEQAKAAAAQQMAEQQAMLQKEVAAKIDEIVARAEKLRAESEKIKAEAATVGGEAGAQANADVQKALEQAMQKIADLTQQIAIKDVELANKSREIDADVEKERIKATSKDTETRLTEGLSQLADELDQALQDVRDELKKSKEPA